MTVDCVVDIMGWIHGTPIFDKKDGRGYVSFIVCTPNGTSHQEILSFQCFAWEGYIYDLIHNMNLIHGDNVRVLGTLSTHKYFSEKNGCEEIKLNVNTKHIRAIDLRNKRVEKKVIIEQPVTRQVSKFNNQSTSEDDEYEWGE